MLRRLDLEAAYLAYGLAAFWLAASSFFAWLVINGFGLDAGAPRPSITTIEYITMIAICVTPTLGSCALATIALLKRRPWQASVFGFAALMAIAVCIGIASLVMNRAATGEF